MNVLGLMSGTSADGIDAALCAISGAPPHLQVELLGAHTVLYPPEPRARILAACRPETSTVDALCTLNFAVGEWFAEAANALIARLALPVDLIASHGQTVWHHAESDGRINATLQIGEASVIAERTGVTTISNFRARDVAAGGQGAPLVGYVDWLLLRHPTRWRAVQNIGGIANVTLLPPLDDDRSLLIGFDTGPGNGLIDAAVSAITDGAQAYDAGGALAGRGRVDTAWLETLMDHAYFQRPPPKTTGREWLSVEMARRLVAEGRHMKLSDESIVATLTAWTAFSIADALQRFAPAPIAEIIVGGGGTHNSTLMDMLQTAVGAVPVSTHEALGMSSDDKEALAFAVLGYETWHGRSATLPAQTGARHPSVLGAITPGANYASLIRSTWGAR